MKTHISINSAVWSIAMILVAACSAEEVPRAEYVMKKKIEDLSTDYSTLRWYRQIAEKPGTNDWPGLRVQSAEKWISVWNELEASIITDYEPKPVRPFIPKTVDVWMSGLGPDAVDDPVERQEFIEHRKQKASNARDNHAQRGFRRLKQAERVDFEEFLTWLYWLPPHDRTELEEVLAMIDDVGLRTNVVNRLNEFGEYGIIEYADVQPRHEPAIVLRKIDADRTQVEPEPQVSESKPETTSDPVMVEEESIELGVSETAGNSEIPSSPWKIIFPALGILIAAALFLFKRLKK